MFSWILFSLTVPGALRMTRSAPHHYGEGASLPLLFLIQLLDHLGHDRPMETAPGLRVLRLGQGPDATALGGCAVDPQGGTTDKVGAVAQQKAERGADFCFSPQSLQGHGITQRGNE